MACWFNDYKTCPKDALDLIEKVKQAYEEYDPRKLNRMWLTHQQCMNETLKCNGGNEYKLPHMNKTKLERENKLPVRLTVHGNAEYFDRGEMPP